MPNPAPDGLLPPRRPTLGTVLAFLLTSGLFLSPAAQATDGVAEINHTCAVQTGCFPGDVAGYPITIDGQGGRSYRLTGDLVVPDENTDGIKISTSSITIDLNGFEIVGSGCQGATVNCAPTPGLGAGVERTSISNYGISVKNGSITGMGSTGVFLGHQAEVTNLRVRWNSGSGIEVGFGSTVAGNNSLENAGHGIFANSGSTVSENTAYQNGLTGIFVLSGSNVSGNAAILNTLHGIHTFFGATVQRNTVRSNVGFGLFLGSQSAYRENVITSNVGGTVSGGVNMFSNSCNGTTTCP